MKTNKRAAVVAALTLAACVPEPIEWDSPRDIAGTIGATTRLVMDVRGNPKLVDETPPAISLPPEACEATVTMTRARAGEWYASWFVARPDSSVLLVVARSTDGGATWGADVVADDRDRGRRGCARPRAALDADTTSGYVHVAYFIEPREGAGVWYTHSMEHGALWHEKIGVLFGDAPASASIASAGDTVLVAYEHPGARGTRLGIAISRQSGHVFAERLRAVRVNGTVRDPRIALASGRVALAWTERQAVPNSSGVARTRVREGRVR